MSSFVTYWTVGKSVLKSAFEDFLGYDDALINRSIMYLTSIFLSRISDQVESIQTRLTSLFCKIARSWLACDNQ